MLINFSEISPTQAYFLMTQTILPRPIAWVLSENQNESFNLAPYSFFNAIGSEPPLLMYSAGKRRDGSHKDSLTNVLRTQKCVIHIASAEQINQVHQTGTDLPPGHSEIDEYNIKLTEFTGFTLPRLAHAPVAFGCELYKVDEIGDKPMSLVFAEIKQAYIRDDAVSQDGARLKIDSQKINPLARLGGMEYSAISDVLKPE
ncbi:flavin reductase family protein [Catenovulum sp. 2E275]|uniref:flavin reductase family protein n=1 Tax=Catenovulum sp. 2E275 TaxID=2980497 RepID=UPI0021CE63C6|nr:flavin reductase family protein [Catenovulum sp. 2E275]MCU4676759.1 flavin reductase family protein [Catenovulum sp. 2E275]